MQRVVAGWLAIALGLATLAGAPNPAVAAPPHHEIALTLDPARGAVTVRDRIRVDERRELTLRLSPWMQVSEVRIDGRAATPRRSGDAIVLTLPSAGVHQVEVLAAGVVPAAEQDQTRGGTAPVAGPEGVYLPGWAGWFPQIGDADETFALTIETPPGVRAAAAATFESETLTAAGNSVRFSSTNVRERPSVFAGPYTVNERSVGGVRIRTYLHDTVARLADDYIEAAARHIRMFADEIGPYPFADFHIVSAPLPVGLGFPALTYIDRRILPLPFIKERSLAHEVLHTWWGNGVLPDYAAGNWSEGLTTYMADHALAARRDPAEAAEMRLAWLRDYAALPPERDAAVTGFRSRSHDATQIIGYGKVALIFHMLRLEVGERAFNESLRRFWDAHKFKSAGWPQLRTAFEAGSRADLGWFFEQWTARVGAPRLELADATVAARAGGFEVALTLTQSAPAYRLKVPVEIATATGTVRADVVLDGARATGRISLDAAPVSVRIDPDYALFRRLLPGEAPPILRDVLLDGKARTRLLYDDPARAAAARQLAERLFEAPAPAADAPPDHPADSPLLVIGPAAQIDAYVRRQNLAAPPADIAGKGAARAWTARSADGRTTLFVDAETGDDLQALARWLVHYRSKSFAVLDGGRIVASGVLPPSHGPLVRALR